MVCEVAKLRRWQSLALSRLKFEFDKIVYLLCLYWLSCDTGDKIQWWWTYDSTAMTTSNWACFFDESKINAFQPWWLLSDPLVDPLVDQNSKPKKAKTPRLRARVCEGKLNILPKFPVATSPWLLATLSAYYSTTNQTQEMQLNWLTWWERHLNNTAQGN